jgi:hypothetical protein
MAEVYGNGFGFEALFNVPPAMQRHNDALAGGSRSLLRREAGQSQGNASNQQFCEITTRRLEFFHAFPLSSGLPATPEDFPDAGRQHNKRR